MRGRYFGPGMGELPTQALNSDGALNVPPPLNRPPPGNQQAATHQPGEFRPLADNQSVWQIVTFNSLIKPQMLQQYLSRKFFLIQNKSAVGTLYVGFGYAPTATNGLVLPAGVGYEPFVYPVNEIWVASDIDDVELLFIYGT